MKAIAISLSHPQRSWLSCLSERLSDFFSLMKPRVMSLAVFTALVGLMIAPGHHDPLLGLLRFLQSLPEREPPACSICGLTPTLMP